MNEELLDSIISEEFDYLVTQSGASTPSTDDIRWPAEWRDEKIVEIQRLSELPQNWDSYGAYVADPRSIYYAVSRVQGLATETEDEPRVACLPSGNVMLAWESEDDSRACEMEFLPSGLINVIVVDENDPSADVETTFEGLGETLRLIPGTGM